MKIFSCKLAIWCALISLLAISDAAADADQLPSGPLLGEPPGPPITIPIPAAYSTADAKGLNFYITPTGGLTQTFTMGVDGTLTGPAIGIAGVAQPLDANRMTMLNQVYALSQQCPSGILVVSGGAFACAPNCSASQGLITDGAGDWNCSSSVGQPCAAVELVSWDNKCWGSLPDDTPSGQVVSIPNNNGQVSNPENGVFQCWNGKWTALTANIQNCTSPGPP